VPMAFVLAVKPAMTEIRLMVMAVPPSAQLKTIGFAKMGVLLVETYVRDEMKDIQTMKLQINEFLKIYHRTSRRLLQQLLI